jgi:hypothetical protein
MPPEIEEVTAATFSARGATNIPNMLLCCLRRKKSDDKIYDIESDAATQILKNLHHNRGELEGVIIIIGDKGKYSMITSPKNTASGRSKIIEINDNDYKQKLASFFDECNKNSSSPITRQVSESPISLQILQNIPSSTIKYKEATPNMEKLICELQEIMPLTPPSAPKLLLRSDERM